MAPKGCFLCTKGKIVAIRDFEDGMQMCAIDSLDQRSHEHMVFVSERVENQTKQMAFYFQFGQSYYCPMVDGGHLKMHGFDTISELHSNNPWFVREYNGRGKYFILRTAKEPTYYLSVLYERPYTFILSQGPQMSVPITEVPVDL